MSCYLELVVIVALAAAFVVLLVKKVGIAEWMQVHGDKYLSQLFGCDFCMSFWASAIFAIGLCCWMDDPSYIFIPLFSTPISRILQ